MAALLLVGVCTAAVAENDGTLTIQNATIGRTYTVYKVFDATYSGTNISYTYKKSGESDALFDALTDTEDALNPFVLTATVVENVYNVTIKTGATAEDISNWLTAHKDLLTQYGFSSCCIVHRCVRESALWLLLCYQHARCGSFHRHRNSQCNHH